MTDTAKALDAWIDPAPLTLGQVALLERIKSPLLSGSPCGIADAAPSLWLLSLPIAEARKRWREAEDHALEWLDALSPAEYAEDLERAYASLAAFLELLPPAGEGGKKKDPETD